MAHDQDATDSRSQDITYHTLDPDGDVFLILNSKDAIISDDDVVDLVSAETWNINHQEYETDEQQSTGPQRSSSIASEPQDEDASMNFLSSDGAAQEIESQAEHIHSCGTGDIEIRVSSRHLSLISPVFRTLLSGNYSEGKALQEKGNVKIALDDDPIRGMMVLLKLLHLDFEQEKITPSLLMQVALLADKYDVAPKIQFWTRLWCTEIEPHIPTQWDANVVSYLGMFSMLKIDDRKEKMMGLARAHVTEITPELDLPISHIIKKLNGDRIAALGKAFRSIDKIVDRYWSSQSSGIICNAQKPTCDAAMLGLLLVGLKKNKLWPLPSSPFNGIRIAEVLLGLKGMDLTSECTRTTRAAYNHGGYYGQPNSSESCICESFKEVVEKLQDAA